MVQIDYTLHIKDFWNIFISPRFILFSKPNCCLHDSILYQIHWTITYNKILGYRYILIQKRLNVTILLYYSSALSLRSKGFDMIFHIAFWSLTSLNVTWVPFHELHISIRISYNWNYEKCNKSLLWCPKCSILMCFHPFNCIFF